MWFSKIFLGEIPHTPPVGGKYPSHTLPTRRFAARKCPFYNVHPALFKFWLEHCYVISTYMYFSWAGLFIWQRKVYNTVVEDVIANVREAFLDEGVDEQVLQELRHVSDLFIWQRKVYNTVIEDMIANVRKAFLDEGDDEQVPQELRHVSEAFLDGGVDE